MYLRKVCSVVLALSLAACQGAGARNFKTAEKYRQEGELSLAAREYEEALRIEPGNKKYQAALDDVNKRVDDEVDRLRGEARSKEKAGDWRGASGAWARASQLRPKDGDLKARERLSAAKAENLDPNFWLERVEAIMKELGNNELLEKTVAGARAAAYAYNIKIATDLLAGGEGSKAYKAYERAQQVDPSMPGLDRDRYDAAAALDLAEQGDLRLAAGDAVEAYDLYKKALDRKNLAEIGKKLAKAKASASAILTKVEAAKAKADQGRWAEALKIYEGLAGTKGVPMSVESEINRIRGEVSKAAAGEAKSAAERGDMRRAQAQLVEALRTTDLPKASADAIRAGADDVSRGQPGKAMNAINGSGAPEGHVVLVAARALARAGARKALDRIKGLARKDAKGALTQLSDLEPFVADLPEINTLRRSLIGGAFESMLDEALRRAKAGDDTEAANLILAALNASKAPDAMRGSTEEGCAALRAKRYADADRAFQQALIAAPKSKLAQRGVDIARLRNGTAQRDAVVAIRAGKGDLEPHVAVLESALRAEPGNESARAGAEALIGRITQASGEDDLKLAGVIGQAARLSELSIAARSAIEEANGLLAQGKYGDAERAFAKAEAASPEAKVAKLAREITNKRKLASLSTGAKAASSGDENAARSLAQLLKEDPNNAQAQKALEELLMKAETAGKGGNDLEASRYLGLVLIATEPAPGVKSALERANSALAGGRTAEAEKAYSDALDLDSDHPGAKLGLELAKKARVDTLRAAVEDAKGGKNTESAKAALKKTLELDPNSAEARKAFADLLGEAKARGAEGRDREAAELLEIANVVSKPETAKKAISDAAKLLGEGRHAESEAAFDKVLTSGESQVALSGRQIAHDRVVAVLVAGVAELKNGGDLDRGAKATAELLKIDATHAEARAAIEGAMTAAEKSAQAGDDVRAAKLLRAVSVATGGGSAFDEGIAHYESGKLDEAEASLGKAGGDVAMRAAKMMRARKLSSLKAGLGGEDQKAAESIRALLKTDPTNKEAQRAFQAILDKARGAAKKLDDKASAAALSAALVASGAAADIEETIKTGITHLEESRHADAERAFTTALDIAKDSKVARTGQEIARGQRMISEKSALAAIQRGDDPRSHAKVLKASLVVEPKSASVQKALGDLLARAKKAADKGSDVEIARSLEAASVLEALPAEAEGKVAEGAAKMTEAKHTEAKDVFAGVEGSKAAALGVELSVKRRIAVLKAEIAAAEKGGDVVKASQLASEVLALDANDAAAKALSKKLGTQVVDRQFELGMAQKGYGKLGAAHLYFRRALKANPDHLKAGAELAAVEKELENGMDLIALVSKTGRSSKLAGACAGIDPVLRTTLMTDGAARQNRLGGYILGPDWAEAVERKDADAPKVNGSLEVTLMSCQSSASAGKISVEFALLVPAGMGKPVVKGAAEAEVPAGMIPRDEQDPAGESVRKLLAKRVTTAVLDKLQEEKVMLELWMLVLAEHAMNMKDPTLCAESYAKALIRKPKYIDPKRAEAVEKYLDAEFK